MISIAMTTYNGEKFILEQLASILNQTRHPDEVIIVDDGSQDNTVTLIEKFICENDLKTSWKLIPLPKNEGYINSFYRAISEVQGDIIFLCDQDDIWKHEKIEIMSEYMLNNKEILVLTSSFLKVDENSELIESEKNIFKSNNGIIKRRIKHNQCIKFSAYQISNSNISPGCTSAFKKEIQDLYVNCIGNDPDTALIHDWKINFVAAIKDGLFYLNTPTIYYRLHDNNSIGIKGRGNLYERLKILNQQIIEKTYFRNILLKIYKFDKSISNSEYERIEGFINALNKIYSKRIKALENASFTRGVMNLLNKNIFHNKLYESMVMDLGFILKNKKVKK